MKSSRMSSQIAHIPPPERSLTGESFRAFSAKNCHYHNHDAIKIPHLHKPGTCDRYASGLDRNRENRLYFTKQRTSVRVYLNYNEGLVPQQEPENVNKVKESKNIKQSKHAKASKVHEKEDKYNYKNDKNVDKTDPVNLNGRKLSPRTLRGRFNVSNKLIEDAKELVYAHDSLSFVPVGYQAFLQPLPKPITFADTASIPIVPVVPIPTTATSQRKKMTSESEMAEAGQVVMSMKKTKKGKCKTPTLDNISPRSEE